MISYRTNTKPVSALSSTGTADDLRAMEHHARNGPQLQTGGAGSPPIGDQPPPLSGGMPGDIIYGARAIALYLFNDGGNRARRRVFNLWIHYRERKERAGFFKLKGALCLSKKQWRDFHGL